MYSFHTLILANRHRLAVEFIDPATGKRISMNRPPPDGLDMTALRKLHPEPLGDDDIHDLVEDDLPVVYSLDHQDFVVLCRDELDRARKRRTMAARYDRETADTWVYLILDDGETCPSGAWSNGSTDYGVPTLQ